MGPLLDRDDAAGPVEHGHARFTSAAQLDAAFLWEAIRTVAARTAPIKFQGNVYGPRPNWPARR